MIRIEAGILSSAKNVSKKVLNILDIMNDIIHVSALSLIDQSSFITKMNKVSATAL